ncbi:SgcJ/EcaC family oxidoreductase [Nocardia sp. CC227C]|uniref:YybH family protein n=1 Tax=Nocardia sp. CC227C TaxID=3044562 RepID=UPI00278BFC68|nr:SgcJ/EcaC family oxidoreductase [Nocardia sp. CC227C]
MTNDEHRIRTLIEAWAAAVRAGDLDGVLTGHTDDIVMFDVPPPHDGVRGIAAYRQTWPPFFTWLADGADFDILSLDVTAGTDVAFAHALLRCGTPDTYAKTPELRLRLTLGLRKVDGEWQVSHEHHSFPDSSIPDPTALIDAATTDPGSGT